MSKGFLIGLIVTWPATSSEYDLKLVLFMISMACLTLRWVILKTSIPGWIETGVGNLRIYMHGLFKSRSYKMTFQMTKLSRVCDSPKEKRSQYCLMCARCRCLRGQHIQADCKERGESSVQRKKLTVIQPHSKVQYLLWNWFQHFFFEAWNHEKFVNGERRETSTAWIPSVESCCRLSIGDVRLRRDLCMVGNQKGTEGATSAGDVTSDLQQPPCSDWIGPSDFSSIAWKH